MMNSRTIACLLFAGSLLLVVIPEALCDLVPAFSSPKMVAAPDFSMGYLPNHEFGSLLTSKTLTYDGKLCPGGHQHSPRSENAKSVRSSSFRQSAGRLISRSDSLKRSCSFAAGSGGQPPRRPFQLKLENDPVISEFERLLIQITSILRGQSSAVVFVIDVSGLWAEGEMEPSLQREFNGRLALRFSEFYSNLRVNSSLFLVYAYQGSQQAAEAALELHGFPPPDYWIVDNGLYGINQDGAVRLFGHSSSGLSDHYGMYSSALADQLMFFLRCLRRAFSDRSIEWFGMGADLSSLPLLNENLRATDLSSFRQIGDVGQNARFSRSHSIYYGGGVVARNSEIAQSRMNFALPSSIVAKDEGLVGLMRVILSHLENPQRSQSGL